MKNEKTVYGIWHDFGDGPWFLTAQNPEAAVREYITEILEFATAEKLVVIEILDGEYAVYDMSGYTLAGLEKLAAEAGEGEDPIFELVYNGMTPVANFASNE